MGDDNVLGISLAAMRLALAAFLLVWVFQKLLVPAGAAGIYKNFYGPFFPQFPQGDAHNIIESMKKSEIFIGGTVDESIRQWRVIYDQCPAEYITLIWHWAEQPKDDMLEEMRLFMERVLPELEIPDYKQAAA